MCSSDLHSQRLGLGSGKGSDARRGGRGFSPLLPTTSELSRRRRVLILRSILSTWPSTLRILVLVSNEICLFYSVDAGVLDMSAGLQGHPAELKPSILNSKRIDRLYV